MSKRKQNKKKKLPKYISKLMPSDIRAAAVARGGSCLTPERELQREMVWLCDRGHMFKATVQQIIGGDYWCEICENHNRRLKMKKKAKERRERDIGGTLGLLYADYPAIFPVNEFRTVPLARDIHAGLYDDLMKRYGYIDKKLLYRALSYWINRPCYQTVLTGRDMPRYDKYGNIVGNVSKAENEAAKKWLLSATDVEARVVIYTDGSVKDDVFTWAFIVYNDDETELFRFSGRERFAKNDTPRSDFAELFAVVRAVEWLRRSPYERAEIRHDSQSVSLLSERVRPATAKSFPFAEAYFEYMMPFIAQGIVAFRHISAHTGDSGNEQADTLCTLAYVLPEYKRGKIAHKDLIYEAKMKRALPFFAAFRRRAGIMYRWRVKRKIASLARNMARRLGMLLLRYADGGKRRK